jgi:L-galactose dehydrogenase
MARSIGRVGPGTAPDLAWIISRCNKMNYRELGRTGIHVSLLGFGAAPLGGIYGHVSDREALRLVKFAIENGINYFDTSPAYGDGLSEIRLGKSLTGCRQQVVLASKAGRYQVGKKIEFDFSAIRLRKSLEESLTRLGTDYLDIFQLHDVEFADFDRILDEALPELQTMKREGKIRAVGLTGRPPGLLARLAEEGRPDMVLSYSHYTLLNASLMDRLAPVCDHLHIGLVNAAPLDMGLLSPLGPQVWHPASAETLAAVRKARRFCTERGISLEVTALKFSQANPLVASTLVGMRTRKELKQNISLWNSQPDPAHSTELRELLKV